MTAFHSRAVLIAALASTLGGCAMGAPQYPVRESAAPAGLAAATSGQILAVNNLVQTEPANAAPASSGVVQTDQTNAPVTNPAPTPVTQAQLPPAQAEPAPITDAPLGANVQPPVNRRPGAEREPLAPAPTARAGRESAQALRAARTRTPAPPAPAPAHPLVAGRVESVHDVSHTIEVEKGDKL